MKRNISTIKNILSAERMDVKIVKKSDIIKHEHIMLNLKEDYKDRPIYAYIWPDEQKIESEENSEEINRIYIQILVILPYKFEEEAVSQLSRYLLVINKSLAFPGFCISETDQSIFYKYTLTFPNGQISKSFLLDFIGLLWLILDSFSQKIENISNNTKTIFETVYQQN
jgi:hypothetical protein